MEHTATVYPGLDGYLASNLICHIWLSEQDQGLKSSACLRFWISWTLSAKNFFKKFGSKNVQKI